MDVIINIPSEPIICSICLSSLYTKQNEIEEGENKDQENKEGENEEVENEEKIIILSCSHSYHTDCIKSWSHYKGTCPLCRSNIKNKEIDAILDTENQNQNQNQNHNLPSVSRCDCKIWCILLCYLLFLPIMIVIIILYIRYT